MSGPLPDRIEQALGQQVSTLTPLSGGDIGQVFRATLANGTNKIIKLTGSDNVRLAHIEAQMLRYLADNSSLPVPMVLFVEDGLLILNDLGGSPGLTRPAQEEAGRHIAQLHQTHHDKFGLSFDTVIGPLDQPNTQSDDWLSFFRDKRLLYMANAACSAGKLPPKIRDRIEMLADRLADLIPKSPKASLLHGDLWGGNILGDGDKITGFIDPAIYYGHREADLAFITLFASVGQRFFDAYAEIYSIDAGFFETRRDLYNLWPLLVHVRLFGGHYIAQLDQSLRQFGV